MSNALPYPAQSTIPEYRSLNSNVCRRVLTTKEKSFQQDIQRREKNIFFDDQSNSRKKEVLDYSFNHVPRHRSDGVLIRLKIQNQTTLTI